MLGQPVFAGAGLAGGMYESFYLRAVSPSQPLGLWIRHTIHKAPGLPAQGSVWCTVFDPSRSSPLMHKSSHPSPAVPADGWIELGADTRMGPSWAAGHCGEASWSLRWQAQAAPLHHLRPAFLYRTPLPRTKLISPAPLARFDGRLELPGRPAIELSGWPGMVGHNWGSEHAARWIWLHGCAFREEAGAWLDLALGRIAVGGRLTPWVASGMLMTGGRSHRIGVGTRPQVHESPGGCSVQLPGRSGMSLSLQADSPSGSIAGWRYNDPDGGEHDVANCSIARITVQLGQRGQTVRTLRSDHGGVYELGMRERDHGVPIAPFADG